MKNTEIIQCRPERASFLFRKWKGGLDDESTLKEKWLTFHDHKWLTFKRPLTLQGKILRELGSSTSVRSLSVIATQPLRAMDKVRTWIMKNSKELYIPDFNK